MNKGKSTRDKGELLPGTYPCTDPACGSSDALRVYRHKGEDGTDYYDATCFSCKKYEPNPPGFNLSQPPAEVNKPQIFSRTPQVSIHNEKHDPFRTTSQNTLEEILNDFKTYPCRAIIDRGLTKETCEKYGVRVSLSPTDGETIITHMYPYYKKDKLTGYKERVVLGKNIYSKGDCREAQLFGSHCCNPSGKTLFITEGELDCLALYQTLKALSGLDTWEPAVVSLSHGAASAAKDISLSMDFVDSYEKIVLVFDQDDAGQAAVEDACKLLAGKVYIAKLSEKDPNDMLLKGKAEEMKWEVLKHARQYMPDNIVNYADCWERYKDGKNQQCFLWPEGWKDMNDKTYGIRMGELVTITAGSGVGKTQIMRELKYHFFESTDFKMADIALEEDVGDSIAGLMSLKLNKRITLPDVEVDPDEERSAFNYFFDSGRWTGYDYFGGLDDDNLFSKVRFLAATGHKIIFLDHLSIIVSEFAAEGGERERIDTIMTKLAKMVKELNITIFLIVHLKKSDGKPFEEGYVPTLDDLRGSGTLKQLSWMVIAIARNQQHEDAFCANTSELTVLKCRFTGRTGVSDYLNFNDETGRMIPVPKPHNYRVSKKKPSFSPDNSPF